MIVLLSVYAVVTVLFAIFGLVRMSDNAEFGEDDTDYQIGKYEFSWCFFPPMIAIKIYRYLDQVAKENSEDE